MSGIIFSNFSNEIQPITSYNKTNEKNTISLFSYNLQSRINFAEDAEAIGFRIIESSCMDAFCEHDCETFGKLIVIDSPHINADILAAITRVDRRGAAIIISTSIDALEDIFVIIQSPSSEILISPSRADGLAALIRMQLHISGRNVRELSDQDRLLLLRLYEQVNQIAERMQHTGALLVYPSSSAQPVAPGIYSDGDGTDPTEPKAEVVSAFRFVGDQGLAKTAGDVSKEHIIQKPIPTFPDSKMIRRVIRQRQLRSRFFDGDLFADPAWDMLLDLTAARGERSRVSVTSLCIASCVPPTTALRWIGQMTEAGLFERHEDQADRRRAFITLTEKAADAMTLLFADLTHRLFL